MSQAGLPLTVAKLGQAYQMAFMPQDFDKALDYWINKMGVGPFFLVNRFPVEDVKYRGDPASLDMGGAYSYWGDIHIELFRINDNSPSIFLEAYERGDEGLHHTAIRVSDIEAASAVLKDAGGVPVQEMSLSDGQGRAIFFEMPGCCPMIEVVELGPDIIGFFDFMRDAAKNWDGSNPIRRYE